VFSQRYTKLSSALISARHESNLTQIDLAKKLRRPQSFVSKYERGERRLDVIEFIEVAEALRIVPGQVIDEIRG
ncbi:helix-turn-helix transcriptional regulator, partial [Escherichia coli]|uniref:helix-turn-helix domain-containing protein n=1 Tax=Escherichia coli TaxID=562 RepID=UPI0028E019AB